MKVRIDFVTNSSSTAYLIKNTSDKTKTIVDFVKENPDILRQFNSAYDYDYTEEQLLESAQKLLNGVRGAGYDANDDMTVEEETDFLKRVAALKKRYTWKPGEKKLLGFGDEDGSVIGHVYDYGLRDGGKSESFEFAFEDWWR